MIIFRYGPRRFPEYRPQYYGGEITISPDETLYLKASYRSWANQFHKLNVNRITTVEAEKLSADSVMEEKVVSLKTPVKTISAGEYKKAIKDLAEESDDSGLFRYSSSGIRIRIQNDENDTSETDSIPPVLRTRQEIEDNIKGAKQRCQQVFLFYVWELQPAW